MYTTNSWLRISVDLTYEVRFECFENIWNVNDASTVYFNSSVSGSISLVPRHCKRVRIMYVDIGSKLRLENKVHPRVYTRAGTCSRWRDSISDVVMTTFNVLVDDPHCRELHKTTAISIDSHIGIYKRNRRAVRNWEEAACALLFKYSRDSRQHVGNLTTFIPSHEIVRKSSYDTVMYCDWSTGGKLIMQSESIQATSIRIYQ